MATDELTFEAREVVRLLHRTGVPQRLDADYSEAAIRELDQRNYITNGSRMEPTWELTAAGIACAEHIIATSGDGPEALKAMFAGLITATPLEEERAARALERRMANMRRQARRSAEETRKHERRLRIAHLREQLRNVERNAATATREYGKALTAYMQAKPEMEPLRGRQLDAAYNHAMGAATAASKVRHELDAVRHG